MAPKKLTKEERAAAKRRKEEEARLAEEARLREEEAARAAAAAAEARRRALADGFFEAQAARLARQAPAAEREAARLAVARRAAAAEREKEGEWRRHVACARQPDPRNAAAMNSHLTALEAAVGGGGSGGGSAAAATPYPNLTAALADAAGCLELERQCRLLGIEAALAGATDEGEEDGAGATAATEGPAQPGTPPLALDRCHQQGAAADEQEGAAAVVDEGEPPSAEVTALPMAAATAAGGTSQSAARCAALAGYARRLLRCADAIVGRATAAALFRPDCLAAGGRAVEAAAPAPPGAGSSGGGSGLAVGLFVWSAGAGERRIEWPGVGVAVDLPPGEPPASGAALRVLRTPAGPASGAGAPAGGVWRVDLLPLPAAPRRAGAWLVREVPDAAAAAADWAEGCGPLVLTVTVPDGVIVGDPVAVARWDDAAGGWSEEGASGARFDPAARALTFSAARPGAYAVTATPARALPCLSWDLRPLRAGAGGGGGAGAGEGAGVSSLLLVLRLGAGAPGGGRLEVEIGSGWARLAAPRLPELAALCGARLPPAELLAALAGAGAGLTPPAGAARSAKDAGVERRACLDVARVAGGFAVASSRWNFGLGPQRCCCRLLEADARSEAAGGGAGALAPEVAAAAVGAEEATGGRRVLVAVWEGAESVAFADAPDGAERSPERPSFDTLDVAAAAAASPFGRTSLDLPSLLAEAAEEASAGGGCGPEPSGGAGAAEGAGPLAEGAPPPAALRAADLAASPAALEAAASLCPAASEAAAQLLFALRLFSWAP